MARTILTLNAGSSSIKFALFGIGDDGPEQAVAGAIEGIGIAPHLTAHDAGGALLAELRWADSPGDDHETLLGRLLVWIDAHLCADRLVGVGHRVVHGGTRFFAPAPVTPDLMAALDALVPLAPLHQPHNLAAIRAVAAIRPGLPQIACFDTAFHHDQPPVAKGFALPRALEDEGVRRYGFHGLSYEYIARRLGEIDPGLVAGRVVVAHLGNGASLCGMHAGRSIDTTMGFTALDGLMMGTRCGAIDPGVLLYLQDQKGMTAQALQHLLYEQSGLLGVSGISSDMRVLLESTESAAGEAIELFVYRIVRETGGLVASLRGLDGLVFTAGIGANAPEIRARIGRGLAWLGVDIDADANRNNAPVISVADSRVTVRVIPTDEERMIAIHALALLATP
jgi:acetate kinase